MSGTVQDWPGGTATVRPVVTDETGTVVLQQLDVSSTISETGSFELQLPPVVSSDLLSVLPVCLGTFEGTAAPEQWGEFFAEMGVFQGDRYVAGLILASSPDVYDSPQVGDRLLFRLYVDRDVTVQGTCFEMGFTREYDASALAGWNHVMLEVTEVGADGFASGVRVTIPQTIPAGLDWYYVDYFQGAALR